MARFGPKSIRGKVTLLASIATAVAMVLIVAVMGYTMRLMLENAIAESLNDRIDQALAEVEQGDYAAAVDSSGSEIIQVVDAQGNIVAESRNARGLKALDVDAGTTEVAELAFALDDESAADASSATDVEDEVNGASDAGAESSAEEVVVHLDDDDGGDDDGDEDDADDADADDGRSRYSGQLNASGTNDDDRSDDSDDDPDEVEEADDENDSADEDSDEAEDAHDEDSDDDSNNSDSRDGREKDGASDDDADGSSESDDDGESDDVHENDDEDDGPEAADDDDDDDDADSEEPDDGELKKANLKTQQSLPAKMASKMFPLGHAVAWAAEPSASSSSSASSASNSASAASTSNAPDVVDARNVLGAEGPYIVQRKEAQSPDGPMSIVGVASLASAVRSAWRMVGLLSAIMAGVLVAVAAFAWLLTGRTLRPVEDMRAKAASITAQNLNERIDIPQSDKDLARLAETLNEMLARIGRALDEEKRFISDASHELKSPIAASSIILDSLRAHPEALDVAHAVEDLTSENSRMASIVSDMLALTRYDEGRLAYRPEPIDLMDLVMEESLSLQARSSASLDLSDLQPVVCRADPELLAHAVRNVLDNASHYAKSKVKVSCGQSVQDVHESREGQENQENQETQETREDKVTPPKNEEGGNVFIRVSDDGCGIPPADRERVFGRFVCLNEGHTGSQGGTGLGLAVVASAIDAHGGSVVFTDPEIGGATVVIEIPQEPQSVGSRSGSSQ